MTLQRDGGPTQQHNYNYSTNVSITTEQQHQSGCGSVVHNRVEGAKGRLQPRGKMTPPDAGPHDTRHPRRWHDSTGRSQPHSLSLPIMQPIRD